MSEQIRSWPDGLFYYSVASTANVREQLSKVQQASKLLRALSDASTVNTNGDKLQDILTGLSLGNSTQRHKYRVLYDTTNDLFLVQRNSGTDASKTWVELLRIDSSGNVTTTGTLSTDSLTTTAGGITLGGTLDVNDFYIKNVDKIIGQTRTDTLVVHDSGSINSLSIAGNSLKVGTTEATPFAYTSAKNSADQSITGTVEANITSLTALSLPNTSIVTSRTFKVEFAVTAVDDSGSTNAIAIKLWNGPNGNMSDTFIYQAGGVSVNASKPGVISGLYVFTPAASNRTKVGLSCVSDGNCSIFGTGNIVATILITELP